MIRLLLVEMPSGRVYQEFRALRGKPYPLWLILLLVIMATMSDCYGYRALEDFARRHHQALLESLELPPMGFPSDSTFRRVMMSIDFTQLAQVLTNMTTALRTIAHDLEKIFLLIGTRLV